MPDTFAITILFLIISTAVVAFIRGRTKDKCLKGFLGNTVILEMRDGKTIQGTFLVESTGLELIYPKPNLTEGHANSYIIYKNEFPNIGIIICPLNTLTEKERKKRENILKKIHHPSWLKRRKRKIRNLFATIHDSVNDVINLLLGRLSTGGIGSRVMTGQQKYITQMKQEFTGTLNTSFEPLMEKNIGHRVIVTVKRDKKPNNLTGLLKEYSSQFLTLMDVEYPEKDEKSDIIIPRDYGIVRHFIE